MDCISQIQRQITLRDGSQAEVYEHGMSLSIVALRGSGKFPNENPVWFNFMQNMLACCPHECTHQRAAYRLHYCHLNANSA